MRSERYGFFKTQCPYGKIPCCRCVPVGSKAIAAVLPAIEFFCCGHGCQQIAVGAGSEQDAPNRRPYISPHLFKHTSDNYRRPTGINADNAAHYHPLIIGNWPAMRMRNRLCQAIHFVSCRVRPAGLCWEGVQHGGFEWAGLQH